MIDIVRGDTKILKFQRKNDEGVITDKAKELYFTVKETTNKSDYILQKKLDDGIEFDTSDHYYRITISPEDTNNLYYGTYKYDIEVKEDEYTKTIELGDFIIKEEVTFVGNEVSE